MEAVRLDDQKSGARHATLNVQGVAVTRRLSGALSITGLTAGDGSLLGWTIPGGSEGWARPPGTGKAWQGLQFQYTNPADAGAAIAIYQPF
jgi:hypothetical protein